MTHLTGFARLLLLLVFLPLLVTASDNERAGQQVQFQEPDRERAGRVLDIYEAEPLGIYVWLERRPKWRHELRYTGTRAIVLATTPPATYPPASMSILSFPNAGIHLKDLQSVADLAFATGLRQFGLPTDAIADVKKEPAEYGVLMGYEMNFQAKVHGTDSDVKIFLGMQEGKFPVLLQIYTLKGKMAHLSGQIRRAWTGTSYIE